MVSRSSIALCLLALSGPLAGQEDASRERMAMLMGDAATTREALASELGRLGADAVPDLFLLHVDGAVPSDWGGTRVVLSETQLGAVREALIGAPPTALRGHLGSIAGAPTRSTPAVVLGLELLAVVGDPMDVQLCIQLATPGEEEAGVPRARRVAFEEAAESILHRDDGAAWVMKGAFTSLHPSLTAPVIRVIGSARTDEMLELLAGLMGRVDGIDDMILAEITRMANDVTKPVPEIPRVHIRYALASQDIYERVLAIGALGALDDFDSIPRLLDLLSDPDERVRDAAEAALERMTGRKHRRSVRAWSAWYEEEYAWWQSCSDSLRNVNALDPVTSLQALQDISGHRIYRHELATAVSDALSRPEQELVLIACSILRSLDSRAAIPALVQALDRTEPEIVAAAHKALCDLTGLDLPADAEPWLAHVGPENVSRRG